MPHSGLCQNRSAPSSRVSSQLSIHISSLVEGHATSGSRRERKRVPLPLLLELTPLESDGTAPPDATVVVGKDISVAGIGFFHQHLIPQRRVLLRLELPGLEPLELEVEMLWCHFTRQGWYESGGRIVAVNAASLDMAQAG